MSQNSKSQPYNIHHFVGYHYFETDNGITYSCRFSNLTSQLPPLLGIYDINVYDFEFFPDKEPVPDPKVSETLIELVDEYLDNKSDVVLYLCDASDGRPQARQALFTRWGKNMADRIEHRPIVLTAGEYEVYGGLFMSKEFEHPDILQSELIDKAPQIIQAKFGG